ncbi:hypothetical protein VTO42DRAFT_7415 [Malbranchea cinnamomea]
MDPYIGRYEVLQNMPDPDFALSRLRKVVSLVKPIMRKYNLRVGNLREFYPAEANLLGVNYGAGETICLRLRAVQVQNEYLALEAVVDSFLHELAHNTCGDHGPQFRATWELYRRERHQLIQNGFRGEGFDGPGIRLGGRGPPAIGGLGRFPGGFVGGAGPIWFHSLREAAANAAERRTLWAGSGQKLGRSATPPFITLDDGTKVVAGCPERTPQHEDGVPLVLPVSDPDCGPNPIPSTSNDCARPKSPPFGGRPPQQVIDDDDVVILPSPPSNSTTERTWECPVCTFLNPDIFLCCDACCSERPAPKASQHDPVGHRNRPQRHQGPAAATNRQKSRKSAAELILELDEKIAQKPLGWVCQSCGTFMDAKWWTCTLCGTMGGLS